MISEIDAYRTANILIEQHGEEAANVAAIRADTLLQAGNKVGNAAFMMIIKAIKDLQSTAPKGGEIPH